MNINKFFIGLTIAAGALVTSCSAPKNITYMQGFDNGDTQVLAEQRRITVQPDDKLSIVVSSKDPALAEVFNLAIAQTRVGASSGSSSSGGQTAAFTVSPDGTIQYPIIGEMTVAGLSRTEVAAKIKKELIGRNLLKDPIVTVEFLNATVTVLGDVSSPGEYPIDRDDLNILQAISKAGDLNITGMRNNVLVVREEFGQDIAYRIDLTDTKALMESPAYYLQQNDVIYVEPNDTKKRQANANGNTALTPSFWMSVGSFLITIAVLVFK